jgi:hypothetical protein
LTHKIVKNEHIFCHCNSSCVQGWHDSASKIVFRFFSANAFRPKKASTFKLVNVYTYSTSCM